MSNIILDPKYMPVSAVAPPGSNLNPLFVPLCGPKMTYVPPPPVRSKPYTSPNPVADFICAPTHTTPWPHSYRP
jgi:hypothetical protein